MSATAPRDEVLPVDPLLERFPAAAALAALSAIVRDQPSTEVGSLAADVTDTAGGPAGDRLETEDHGLAAALERLAESAGAAGVFVESLPPALPPFVAGAGTLRDPGSSADVPGAADVAHVPGAADVDVPGAGEPIVLRAEDGTPLARVRIAGAGSGTIALARVLELVLRAAASAAEAHRVRDRLVALDEATRAIAGELHPDRVLQLIVDRVRVLIGGRYAALGIANAHGRIETFITAGITAEERARIGPPPEGHGMLGLIIRERRPLRVDDIATHPQRHGFPPHHPLMTTLLGVPIIVDGRAVGNLYLADKHGGHPFSEDDQTLVEMFALRAGIAIENARLHAQVGRLAIVDERERIGRDLHDGIIQSIYGVSLALEDVPELMADASEEAERRVDRAIDALHQVIGDIREYILDLRPELGRDDDAVAAIARLAEELQLSAVVDVDMELEGGAAALRGLPPHVGADIVAITREALSNVARHSGATRASIALRVSDGRLVLEIADNGRGFVAPGVRTGDEHGRHQGLRNIRDRAVGVGGAVRVESEPGAGTRIIVTLPVTPPTAAPAPHGPGEAPGDRHP